MPDIVAHYAHQLLSYSFAAVVGAIIVVIIHRAFQRVLLSTLDEVRDSTQLFRRLANKELVELSDSERDLIGRLVLAYALLSGLVFVGIMLLLSDLATPVG